MTFPSIMIVPCNASCYLNCLSVQALHTLILNTRRIYNIFWCTYLSYKQNTFHAIYFRLPSQLQWSWPFPSYTHSSHFHAVWLNKFSKNYIFNETVFMKQSPDKFLGTCSVPDCVPIGGKILKLRGFFLLIYILNCNYTHFCYVCLNETFSLI